MSAPSWIGWSAGLAGLAGGAFWLAWALNVSPTDLELRVAEVKASAPPGAAPGLTAPAPTVDPPAATDVDARLRWLETQVQTLGQQLSVQQQTLSYSREALARLTRTLEQQRLDDAAREGAAQTGEPPSPQEEQAAAEARMALLDRQVHTEQVDPRWSGPATEQIRAMFNDGTLTGSKLLSVTCQTTMCRVEVDHRDSTALDQFIGEFPTRLDWSTSSYSQIIPHEDGSATLVLYVSREGYRLPRPDV